MFIMKQFAELQKKIVGVFWKSSWLTASKFAEVEPRDKCLPWNTDIMF